MRNDDDWIAYLRKEEEKYLPEQPEGLWEGIRDNLPAKRRGVAVPLWLRYCGVAACVVLVLGVGLRFAFVQDGHEPPLRQTAEKSVKGNSVNSEKEPPHTFVAKNICALAYVKTTPPPPQAREDSVEIHVGEGEPTPKQRTDDEHKPQRLHERNETIWQANADDGSVRHRRVAVSLYAGNIMASNNTNQAGFLLSDAGGEEDADSDTPLDYIATLNQGAETETRKHYHLPIRAGIRVAFPINDRLALESGLAYTQLSSTTESGSSDNYYSTEQKLHYIGVPLRLRCKLWTGKRLGVYVSGGGMVEKCVSGSAKTKYILGGEKNADSKQDVTEKPLQFSATLSAGIEANIAKHVSLFAEPGVSYYIDNHSSVDNIYKDKPFNFDLHVGIKVNINK